MLYLVVPQAVPPPVPPSPRPVSVVLVVLLRLILEAFPYLLVTRDPLQTALCQRVVLPCPLVPAECILTGYE